MTRAIVLAGGLGTRLRATVPGLPKPMAPVGGRPFLAHLLDRWIDQGVLEFVLSVGYRHEAIVDAFGERYRGATLAYEVERTPLGTGGALLAAARRLPADAPFLLLNGDTWFDVPLEPLRAFAAERDADCCFTLFRADEPGRYMGIALAADGRIETLRAGDTRRGRPANAGVYLMHPRLLGPWVPAVGDGAHAGPHAGPLSLEDTLFPAWLAAGRRLFGLRCSGAFVDIGVPADYHRAAAVMAGACAPRLEACHG
jgi:D-glycero-alpha-D-manno-heptose 1-phosphate guanylyltransferase